MRRSRPSKHAHGRSEAIERPATARAARKQRAVLAANLRGLRLDLRLTQEEVAEGAGLHPVHIMRLEAGTANPTLVTLVAIAAALKTTASELLRQPPAGQLRPGLTGHAL